MCIYSNNKCMCVFLISPVPIAEPLTSELIDTPVFYNLAPRPIKYRVSVPIPSDLPSIYPFFSLPDSMRSVGWNVVRHAPSDLNTGASPKQTDKSGIQELRHSFCPAHSITVFLMCLDFGSNMYRLLLLSIIYDASSVTAKISDFRQLIIPTHSALVILKRVYFWPKD